MFPLLIVDGAEGRSKEAAIGEERLVRPGVLRAATRPARSVFRHPATGPDKHAICPRGDELSRQVVIVFCLHGHAARGDAIAIERHIARRGRIGVACPRTRPVLILGRKGERGLQNHVLLRGQDGRFCFEIGDCAG